MFCEPLTLNEGINSLNLIKKLVAAAAHHVGIKYYIDTPIERYLYSPFLSCAIYTRNPLSFSI